MSRESPALDAAEPPRIVFERPAPCRDADRAEQLLQSSLSSARAPSKAWTVTMRVEKSASGLAARGEIADDAGRPVAHRDVTGATADCGGLARAIGVWALLVLDAEVERARAVEPPAPPPPKPEPAIAERVEPVAAWPAPAPEEKPSPEHDWYLHHDERRTLEPGLATFLMTGAGTKDAIAGLSPYFVVEAANGLFLRPAVAVGESILSLSPAVDARAVFVAARFDACLRVPGLYATKRGIQLDLCGGADLGFVRIDGGPVARLPASDRTLPHLSLGPSVDLRGELGGDLSVTLRGVTGLNLLRDSYEDSAKNTIDPPAFAARIELALSWRLR